MVNLSRGFKRGFPNDPEAAGVNYLTHLGADGRLRQVWHNRSQKFPFDYNFPSV